MSPEQIEGREVDSRTDIYALGCVIFESLAGATPFRRETEVAVLWAHMREDPPPLSEVRSDLPRDDRHAPATRPCGEAAAPARSGRHRPASPCGARWLCRARALLQAGDQSR